MISSQSTIAGSFIAPKGLPLLGRYKLKKTLNCNRNARYIICEVSNGNKPNKTGDDWKPWSWIPRMYNDAIFGGLWYVIINVVVLMVVFRIFPNQHTQKPSVSSTPIVQVVPYSQFVKDVKKNKVSDVAFSANDVRYTLKSYAHLQNKLPVEAQSLRVEYITKKPYDHTMPYETLFKNKVVVKAADKEAKLRQYLPYMFYMLIIVFWISRMYGKLPQKPNQKRHNTPAVTPNVTFADVQGVDEAKEELQEIVEFLKNPQRFRQLGARPPAGVLLSGPPGTGKTLLAKAVAGEASVPFFSVSASEFVELYVGIGALRVRELFQAARRESPSIVFIDEIDAVAKGRDTKLRNVGNDEREQTLNQLLTELDGFESGGHEQVVVCIAATNRQEVLDTALLRPGRFDRKVSVDRPDRRGREKIMETHMQQRRLPLGPDVDVPSLAGSTMGFTGADLANMVNEAALLAGRAKRTVVTREDFEAAVFRQIAGIEKKRTVLSAVEQNSVAKHEVGHAIVQAAVCQLIPTQSLPTKLSIVPRTSGALGFTYTPLSAEDRYLMFLNEVRAQIAVLFGGRAAEMLTCDDVSTGAVDDIKRATELATRMVTQYGLGSSVGAVNVGAISQLAMEDGGALIGGQSRLNSCAEQEVQAWLSAGLEAALETIKANKSIHSALSTKLKEKERLETEDIEDALKTVTAPRALRKFINEGAIEQQPRQSAAFFAA